MENFIGSGEKTIMVIASNCTISGNSAGFGGGGLDNLAGTVTLTNCTISGNFATDNFSTGGGLSNNGGVITATNCTVRDNSAGFSGGGLENVFGGTATLTNCTVSGNSAPTGGGHCSTRYYSSTTLRMTNCTISGNSATGNGGGGVNNYGGTATLTNVGSQRREGIGGGLYVTSGSVGVVTLHKTTVAAELRLHASDWQHLWRRDPRPSAAAIFPGRLSPRTHHQRPGGRTVCGRRDMKAINRRTAPSWARAVQRQGQALQY